MSSSKEKSKISSHHAVVEKNRLLYLVANVGGHIYVLLTLPMLTRFLTPDEFGFYTILVQIVTITQAAFLVLFSSALLRFYVDYEGEERRQFLGTIIWTFVIIQFLAAAFLYVGRYNWLLFAFPNITIPLDPYVMYAMVWMIFVSLRALALTFVKTLEQSMLIVYQVVIYGMVLIPMLYWLVVVESKGLEGALESLIAAEVLSLLMLITRLKDHVALAWRLQHLKKVLVFSAPLALSSLLFIIFTNADRIILSRYVSLADLGVYGIGFIVGNIAALIVTANNSSYSPRVLKVMKTEGDEVARSLATYFMKDSLALLGLVLGGLTIFNDALVSFLGGETAMLSASMVVVGIAAGHLARSQFLFFRHGLFSKNRTGAILLLNVVLLGLGFGVASILAWLWGMPGVAFMSLVSHMLILPLAFYLTKQHFLIHIPTGSVLKSLFLVVFLVAAELYLNDIGRSLLSVQYWSVKLIELIMLAVLYGRYFVGFFHKIIGEK